MKPIYMSHSAEQRRARTRYRDKKAQAAFKAKLRDKVPKPLSERFECEHAITDEDCKRARVAHPGSDAESAALRTLYVQRRLAARVKLQHRAERKARGLWGHRAPWADVIVTTVVFNLLKLGAVLLPLAYVLPPEQLHIALQFAALWAASRVVMMAVTRAPA